MYVVPLSGLTLVLLRRDAYGLDASVRVAVLAARAESPVVDSGVGLAWFGVGEICRRACAE